MSEELTWSVPPLDGGRAVNSVFPFGLDLSTNSGETLSKPTCILRQSFRANEIGSLVKFLSALTCSHGKMRASLSDMVLVSKGLTT